MAGTMTNAQVALMAAVEINSENTSAAWVTREADVFLNWLIARDKQ